MESALDSSTHSAPLSFLYGRIDYERTAAPPPGLEGLRLQRMRDLLQRLGNPHQRLRIVHLAGTKGKGSTASLIGGVLTAAGHRVGLYSSPHLDRLEERICVDGTPCAAEELSGLIEQVRPAVEAMDAEKQPDEVGPTFFEITTALALLQFRQRAVDFAVLEVGMGGRLDSTNVCQPLITVITSISLDHTRQLGNTLAAIAGEKAGIIKPGVPVISGVVAPEPRDVIRGVAADRAAPLFELQRDFTFRYRTPARQDDGSLGLGHFDFQDAETQFADVELGMPGEHQAANAALAVATLKHLKAQGVSIPQGAIRQGMRGTRLPARIEVVRNRPLLILDVAHNVASIEALVETLRPLDIRGQRVLLFSATREKDVEGMLRRLLPVFDEVILTRYLKNPRSRSPSELAAIAERILAQDESLKTPKIGIFDDPAEALTRSLAMQSDEDLLCVTGSFFLAAEIRGQFDRVE